MKDTNEKINLYYHPDELFDRPYEQVTLDLNNYKSIQSSTVKWFKYKRGITLLFENNEVIEFEVYNKYILRIKAKPYQKNFVEQINLLERNTDVDSQFECNEDYNNIYINNETLKIIFNKATKDISIYNQLEELLLETCAGGISFSDQVAEYGGYRCLGRFKIGDEGYFGFGGRTMHPNRKGSSVDMFNIKAGVRKGDYGGCAIPFFMSTKGYGFLLNNPWPHVYFDMGRNNPNEWFFNTTGGICDIFIIAGPEFNDIVRRYTALTGNMPTPPKWLFGFWASSLTIKNSQEVLEVAEKFRELKFPCDVLLIDAEWRVGPKFLEQYTGGEKPRSNDIEWHPEFGDKDELISRLKSLGYKLGLHLNSRNFSIATEEYGIQNQYIIKHNDESYINFMNDEAKMFYEELLKPRIEEGVDLWWVDHSDRVSGEIAEGIPCRNLLGIYWSEFLTKTMNKYNASNVLSLTRGSGIGGQKYGFPWPGDTSNGIEFFEEDLWYCMNVGLSGFPISSVDIGGFNLKNLFYGKIPPEYYSGPQDIYDEVFDKDNILRRVCQSLLCIPVIRLHNNWCTVPKFPWHCKEDIMHTYRLFLEERYKLVPYYYSAAIHGSKTGEPVLKPLVYNYRQDKDVFDIGDECLLGDSLLVAPVTKANVFSRSIYLPEGKWFYMWGEQNYIGPCTIEVETPMYGVEGLPIFVKAGSIIPRQEVMQYLEEDIPQTLILDYYMIDQAELILYEAADVIHSFKGWLIDDNIHLSLENHLSSARQYIIKLHQLSYSKLIKSTACIIKNIKNSNSQIIIEVLVDPKNEGEIILQI